MVLDIKRLEMALMDPPERRWKSATTGREEETWEMFSLHYRTRFVEVLFPAAEGRRAGFVAVVESTDQRRRCRNPEHIPFNVFLFAGGLGEESGGDYLGLAQRRTETKHYFVVVVEKGEELRPP